MAKETNYDTDSLQPTATPGVYEYDFVTEKYPGWTTYNIDLGLEWGEDHKWNASLSLRNILDRNYTTANTTIEEPGFHAVLAVGFEF
jgi:outer membrane receptor protein involved in Fe transport